MNVDEKRLVQGNVHFDFSASWTDLIVGAPNFFDRKAEIGGAVYVYLNPFGHWDDQARPIRLNGTYDSMFGMTVSNVGDLDQDGYGGTSETFLLTQNVLILKVTSAV